FPQDGPILRGTSGFCSSAIHGFDRRLRIDDLCFPGSCGLWIANWTRLCWTSMSRHVSFLLYIFKSDGRVFRILANSIALELNLGVLRPVLMLYIGLSFRP